MTVHDADGFWFDDLTGIQKGFSGFRMRNLGTAMRAGTAHRLRVALGTVVVLMAGLVWHADAALREWTSEQLRQNLYATCFVDDKEGWAVGDLGRIFHTRDAAQTWTLQSAGTTKPFVAIACPDRSQLFIAGQAGEIATSTDGGNTWAMQNSGTTRQLLDMSFANAQRGVAVGDFGTIVRTDDGGKTWTTVALPTDTKLPEDVAELVRPGDVVVYGVSFPDPDHVWLVGEFGVILNSTDGGQTFHPQTSPTESSLFGVHFVDAQRGWAVGLEGTLIATTDGGMTWAKQKLDAPYGFSLALYDVDVRGQYGWALGNSGLLYGSRDGGTTWQLMDMAPKYRSGWFRGISLLGDGRGYIVGARGLVVTLDRESFTALKKTY
ncbi:YCF48-related protein [Candidatus Binatia bacterium]|nr:YCF48-related protein [Candidatus Binatia bacterium]